VRLSYNSHSKRNRNITSISFHGDTTRVRERKIIFVNKILHFTKLVTKATDSVCFLTWLENSEGDSEQYRIRC
jgi:hypothetical protein